MKRKIELYWAGNEITFLQAKTTQMENMFKASKHISHEIEFVCTQLRKRFDMAAVNENERKRKAKRVKEQRRKTKKREAL